MSIKFTNNFDKFSQKLENKINSLNGQVSFAVLFNTEFMIEYTEFESFDELLLAGGFKVNSQEDFKAIPDDIFDEHIKEHTQFDSWSEMMQSAGSAYAISQLKF